MWANAQRDGRRKVWLTPTTRMPCSNAAKTTNQLKFAGVPQTNERISAASRPKSTILWGHLEEILLLNTFFPIVDMCLIVADYNTLPIPQLHKQQLLLLVHNKKASIR